MAPTDDPISVIIPCYNQGAYLAECLDSLRKQTISDWEAIVIDDGSDDGETQAAARAFNDPPRVRVMRTENRGLSAARNRGAAEANGKLLFFLDADDLLEPQAIERMRKALKDRPSAAWCYVSTRTFGAREILWPHKTYNFLAELFANGWEPAVMIRREVFEKSGGFSPVGGGWGYEDWDLWVRLGGMGCHGTHAAEALLKYRTKASSMVVAAHAHHGELVAALREKNAAIYESSAILRAKRIWAPGISIVIPTARSFSKEKTAEVEKIFCDFEICDGTGRALWPESRLGVGLRTERFIGKYTIRWDGASPAGFATELIKHIASWELVFPSIRTGAEYTEGTDVAAVARMGEERWRRTSPVWFGSEPPATPDDLEGPKARLALFNRRRRAAEWKRVGWFGAGHYTKRLLAWCDEAARPAVILDDRPEADDIEGIPVRAPDENTIDELDAVLIASDTFDRELFRRAAVLWPKALGKVFRLTF